MGTRHLTGVIENGAYKVAQYGQWDGYIEGQGAVVLNFLQTADLNIFREKLSNVFFATKQQIRECYVKAGDSPDNKSGFISLEVSDKMKELYPTLHRDTGAKVLELIYNAEERTPLLDSSDFLEDDTFCEFAYVIDLDQNKLFCYCWGKKLFASYDLNNLPTIKQMSDDYETFSQN